MASAVGYLVGLLVAVKQFMCMDVYKNCAESADDSDCDAILSESQSK